MRCPVCKTKQCVLIELEENLTVTSCEACGGQWISQNNYSKWLEHHVDSGPGKPFAEIEFDVGDVQDAKVCPDCSRILLKYKVGHGFDFYVDHCSGCGGIWLDANEWKALQAINLHDKLHNIFSTTWQSQVRDEEMTANLERVYIKRFGVETYEKTKEIHQWIQQQPQKQAILAFLLDENPFEV